MVTFLLEAGAKIESYDDYVRPSSFHRVMRLIDLSLARTDSSSPCTWSQSAHCLAKCTSLS
jgi:hypothetical protein